jgi:hypothetical protein
VRAWRDLSSLRDPDHFDAWLHRLLVNACMDEARRHRRHALEVELTLINYPTIRDSAISVDERDALERGFRRLEPEQRALVVLHPSWTRRCRRGPRGCGCPWAREVAAAPSVVGVAGLARRRREGLGACVDPGQRGLPAWGQRGGLQAAASCCPNGHRPVPRGGCRTQRPTHTLPATGQLRPTGGCDARSHAAPGDRIDRPGTPGRSRRSAIRRPDRRACPGPPAASRQPLDDGSGPAHPRGPRPDAHGEPVGGSRRHPPGGRGARSRARRAARAVRGLPRRTGAKRRRARASGRIASHRLMRPQDVSRHPRDTRTPRIAWEGGQPPASRPR